MVELQLNHVSKGPQVLNSVIVYWLPAVHGIILSKGDVITKRKIYQRTKSVVASYEKSAHGGKQVGGGGVVDLRATRKSMCCP